MGLYEEFADVPLEEIAAMLSDAQSHIRSTAAKVFSWKVRKKYGSMRAFLQCASRGQEAIPSPEAPPLEEVPETLCSLEELEAMHSSKKIWSPWERSFIFDRIEQGWENLSKAQLTTMQRLVKKYRSITED